MNTFQESAVGKLKIFATFIFIVFSVWFFVLIFTGANPENHNAQIWSATYQAIAWFGALCGLYFMGLWGGWKSLIGRANLAFTLGLLAQSFGQIVFSYYFFHGVEAPYPSIADIGFFGSIPFYIYGIVLLGQAAGSRLITKSRSTKTLAYLIPAIILILSYFIFLRGYEFDWSQPLVIFLDFGYPLGQAIYISFAIVAYLFSRNFLGGAMKKPIMFFIGALVVQYAADYIFLYQISQGTYTGGLEIDYIYLVAYFIMSWSLLQLGSVFYKIKNS